MTQPAPHEQSPVTKDRERGNSKAEQGRLTANAIKGLKGSAKPYEVTDSGSPGLQLRILPTGAKYWFFRFYWRNKRQRLALGHWPQVTLADARDRAHEARVVLVHAIVTLVRENQRDIGLVRAVGPWAFGASIVSMIVGAGIFVVPSALAACVGPYAPFAFLACGFAIGAVAVCFAEGGSRVPISGGVYGVVEAAFGPLAGYVSGTPLWVCCVLACGAVAAALADVVASLFPQSFMGPVPAAVIVGVLGGIALFNIGGVVRGVTGQRDDYAQISSVGDLYRRRRECNP